MWLHVQVPARQCMNGATVIHVAPPLMHGMLPAPHAGMASAAVMARLVRIGQGVLDPEHGLSALAAVLRSAAAALPERPVVVTVNPFDWTAYRQHMQASNALHLAPEQPALHLLSSAQCFWAGCCCPGLPPNWRPARRTHNRLVVLWCWHGPRAGGTRHVPGHVAGSGRGRRSRYCGQAHGCGNGRHGQP
jgi:hypothetical protein